jgi:type II secretion system protein G
MAWKGAPELMGKARGFTLIELLVVVAIIGIVSAIAIPNLLNSLNRGRQKRCMADMRSIGAAIEAYAVDYQFCPKGITTITDLAPYLTPTYMHIVPTEDGWQTRYYVATDSTGASYTIVSYGKDKSPEGSWSPGATTGFNDDIVFTQGVFYRWPEGVQNG